MKELTNAERQYIDRTRREIASFLRVDIDDVSIRIRETRRHAHDEGCRDCVESMFGRCDRHRLSRWSQDMDYRSDGTGCADCARYAGGLCYGHGHR